MKGFTKRYNINRLVYYETFRYANNAIAREKQIKAWTRAKRIALIKSMNPTWQDLAEGWGQPAELQIPRFTTPASQNRACWGPRLARDDNQGGATGRKKEVAVLASGEVSELRNPN